mmetsp:Transcript_114304/g.323762  ORF Transcript_114304/g.323762 Transcript_114304/m.323762 type:complete len:382 (+) Transcript_114304:113-1258(+)
MPRLAPQPGPTKYLVAAIRERVNVRVNVKLDMRPPRVRARLGHRRGKPSSSSSTSDAGSSCRASRSTTLFFSSSRAISCASPWRAALLPMRPPAPPLTGAALALPGTSGTSGTLCDSCSGGFWAAAASRAASVDVAAAVDMFTSVFSARCLGAAGAVTFPGLRGSGAKACGCGAAAAGAAPQSGDLSLSAASSSSSPSSTALLSAPCCDVTCPTSRRSSEIVCCFARRVFWSRRFFLPQDRRLPVTEVLVALAGGGLRLVAPLDRRGPALEVLQQLRYRRVLALDHLPQHAVLLLELLIGLKLLLPLLFPIGSCRHGRWSSGHSSRSACPAGRGLLWQPWRWEHASKEFQTITPCAAVLGRGTHKAHRRRTLPLRCPRPQH